MKKILPGIYINQRTQAEFPTANCNTTSLYMAMAASGFPDIPAIPDGVAGASKLTPVDFLTRLGDSPEAVEAMRTLAPWFFNDRGDPIVRPPETPQMLDWIASRAWGGNPVRYTESLTLGLLMAKIDAGRASILRTLFTPSGHIVAAVGYETDDSTGKMVSVVLRDPWGNPNNYASGLLGNEVEVSLDFFMAKVRPAGGELKAGHIIVG